jgi:hypothetical protein
MILEGMVTCRLHLESPREYDKTPVAWKRVKSLSLAIGGALPETDVKVVNL